MGAGGNSAKWKAVHTYTYNQRVIIRKLNQIQEHTGVHSAICFYHFCSFEHVSWICCRYLDMLKVILTCFSMFPKIMKSFESVEKNFALGWWFSLRNDWRVLHSDFFPQDLIHNGNHTQNNLPHFRKFTTFF